MELPTDIILEILRYCSYRIIVLSALTSKELNKKIQQDKLFLTYQERRKAHYSKSHINRSLTQMLKYLDNKTLFQLAAVDKFYCGLIKTFIRKPSVRSNIMRLVCGGTQDVILSNGIKKWTCSVIR